MLKILPIIAGVLFILCLPLLLITSNVRHAVNSPSLYEYSFNRYDVEDVTGIERAELDRAAREIISYFNSGNKFIDVKIEEDGEQYDLFTDEDIAHLKDVKHLIRVVYWVQIGTLSYVLAFLGGTLAITKGRRWRWLLGWLATGAAFTLFIIIILGFMALFDFSWVFREFHHMSFSNNLWQMEDWNVLPQMFPEGFFYDATKFIALATALEVALLAGIAGVILYKTRIKKVPETSGS